MSNKIYHSFIYTMGFLLLITCAGCNTRKQDLNSNVEIGVNENLDKEGLISYKNYYNEQSNVSKEAVLFDHNFESPKEYSLSEDQVVKLRELLDVESGWEETEQCECKGNYELLLDGISYNINLTDLNHQIKVSSFAIENEEKEVVSKIYEILKNVLAVTTKKTDDLSKEYIGEDDIIKVELYVTSDLEEYLNGLPNHITIEDSKELEKYEEHIYGRILVDKEWYNPELEYEISLQTEYRTVKADVIFQDSVVSENKLEGYFVAHSALKTLYKTAFLCDSEGSNDRLIPIL